MHEPLEALLARWRDAGILDQDICGRIVAFERDRNAAGSVRLRWPMLLAFSFGAIMVGAGLLLFVAAHWDNMSPALRFASVLGKVALLHALGIALRERSRILSCLFHGLGTVALGAGIFLTGQIFNLQEHWPGGVMLWAMGAWAAFWLLEWDWVQGCLVAMLTPAWFVSEWVEWLNTNHHYNEDASRILLCFLFSLALVYLTARRTSEDSTLRKALAWMGGLVLLPFGIPLLLMAADHEPARLVGSGDIGWHKLAFGLVAALLLPLLTALWLRGKGAVWNLVAAAWVLLLALVQFGDWTVYAYAAMGSFGLVAWGLHEDRVERVNLGIAGFAITLFTFYFAHVMDKLGRSLGLMILGVLFIVGGWQLETLRRRLNAKIKGGVR